MIYYTSDLHLGNKNIIKYEHRPWKTVEEMDVALIDNWNQTVSRNDEIYVLGDFCFKGAIKAIEYLERLNGHIHLIRGNHDRFMDQKTFMIWEETNFLTVPLRTNSPQVRSEGYYKHMKDGEYEVALCHYPILHWENMEQGSIHLYGHCHSYRGCSAMASNSYNVGVDVNNYKPVTLVQLLGRSMK